MSIWLCHASAQEPLLASGCLGVKPKLPTSPFKTWPWLPWAASSSSPAISRQPCVPGITRRAVLGVNTGAGLSLSPECFFLSSPGNTPMPHAWARVHTRTHTRKCAHAPYLFSDHFFFFFETQPLGCLVCETFSLSQSDLGTTSSFWALPLHTSDKTHHFLSL